jgi:excisionase family DNA binding protein
LEEYEMAKKTAIAEKYVTVQKAAEFTGLSVATIRNLIATRDLTAFRPVPGRIVLDLSEIDKFMRRSSGQSSTRGRKAFPSDQTSTVEPIETS